MEVVQSIGAPLDAGFRELRLQEVEKRSFVIDRGLGVLPQPPATNPDMLQRADGIIHADRRITSRQSAVQLSVSSGSAMAIINSLGYSKLCTRRVPRSLTTEHRRQRKAVCSELLERFDAEWEAFMSQIVTGDETCAQHYEPEKKKAVIGVASSSITKKKEVQGKPPPQSS